MCEEESGLKILNACLYEFDRSQPIFNGFLLKGAPGTEKRLVVQLVAGVGFEGENDVFHFGTGFIERVWSKHQNDDIKGLNQTLLCFSEVLEQMADQRMGLTTGSEIKSQRETYQIVGEVGRGGSSIVYRAISAGDQVPCLIKEFYPLIHGLVRTKSGLEGNSDWSPSVQAHIQDAYQQYLRKRAAEAQIVLDLRRKLDEYIEKPIDTFEDKDTGMLYTVFNARSIVGDEERCLLTYKMGQGMPLTTGCMYLLRLLAALHSLHQAGWLHLDISPDNILVTTMTGIIDSQQEATVPIVKLIDLDNARPMMQGHTAVGEAAGMSLKKGYSAPELFAYSRGECSQLTTAADLYSVGAILFFMLFGETPSAVDQIRPLGFAYVSSEHPLFIGLPETSANLCNRILSKVLCLDATKRTSHYPDCAALSFELAELARLSDTSRYSLRSTICGPTLAFRGRDKLLDALEHFFRETGQDEKDQHPARVLFLQGIGGIGKTQLALAYGMRALRRNLYDTVILAVYQGSVRSLLLDDQIFPINNLTRPALGDIDGKMYKEKGKQSLKRKEEQQSRKWNEEQQSRKWNEEEQSRNWNEEEQSRKWNEEQQYLKMKLDCLSKLADQRTLLVLDNYDGKDDPELMTLLNLKWDVLVTSRRNWVERFPVVEVEEIDNPRDLVDLFLFHASPDKRVAMQVSPKEEVAIQGIIDKLDRHTLLVELVARLVRTSGVTCQEMQACLIEAGERHDLRLNEFQGKRVDLLKDNQIRRDTVEGHLRSLFNLSSLNGDELRCLKMLALVPTEGISRRLFILLSGSALGEALDTLVDSGWVQESWNVTMQAGIIRLHPVISDFLFSIFGENEIGTVAMGYIRRLSDSISGYGPFDIAANMADSLCSVLILRLRKNPVCDALYQNESIVNTLLRVFDNKQDVIERMQAVIGRIENRKNPLHHRLGHFYHTAERLCAVLYWDAWRSESGEKTETRMKAMEKYYQLKQKDDCLNQGPFDQLSEGIGAFLVSHSIKEKQRTKEYPWIASFRHTQMGDKLEKMAECLLLSHSVSWERPFEEFGTSFLRTIVQCRAFSARIAVAALLLARFYEAHRERRKAVALIEQCIAKYNDDRNERAVARLEVYGKTLSGYRREALRLVFPGKQRPGSEMEDRPYMTSGKSPAGPLNAAHLEDRPYMTPVGSPARPLIATQLEDRPGCGHVEAPAGPLNAAHLEDGPYMTPVGSPAGPLFASQIEDRPALLPGLLYVREDFPINPYEEAGVEIFQLDKSVWERMLCDVDGIIQGGLFDFDEEPPLGFSYVDLPAYYHRTSSLAGHKRFHHTLKNLIAAGDYEYLAQIEEIKTTLYVQLRDKTGKHHAFTQDITYHAEEARKHRQRALAACISECGKRNPLTVYLFNQLKKQKGRTWDASNRSGEFEKIDSSVQNQSRAESVDS